MDIQMPVMNGYIATNNIRILPNVKKATTPIIAMTANAFDDDKKRALKEGMNGFVSKPIDIDELLNAINEFIR
jgi:CheY-like chemotaxis protein